MRLPLDEFTMPTEASQGIFGTVRRFDIHTGMDLYCRLGDPVYAIEDGMVVNVCAFTGPEAGTNWWNDTQAVLVEGKSGVILYGEVDALVRTGDVVLEGDVIGKILRVLKTDKGRPMDMLHLELYEPGYRGDGEVWNHDQPKPAMLLDPTYLIEQNQKTKHFMNGKTLLYFDVLKRPNDTIAQSRHLNMDDAIQNAERYLVADGLSEIFIFEIHNNGQAHKEDWTQPPLKRVLHTHITLGTGNAVVHKREA
jgi:murein DD-endopeptidase MepM/ murein hydrolase activator NlpD